MQVTSLSHLAFIFATDFRTTISNEKTITKCLPFYVLFMELRKIQEVL